MSSNGEQRKDTDHMVDDAVQRVLLRMKQQQQKQPPAPPAAAAEPTRTPPQHTPPQHTPPQHTPSQQPLGSMSQVGNRLVMDSSGNLVDVRTGSVVKIPTRPVTTVKANIKYQRDRQTRKLLMKKPPDVRRSLGYDPSMKVPVAARGKRSLQINEQGKYVELAKRQRVQEEEQRAGEAEAERERQERRRRRAQQERVRAWHSGECLGLVGETHMRMGSVETEVPGVEWWDAKVLKLSGDAEGSDLQQGYTTALSPSTGVGDAKDTGAGERRFMIRGRFVGNVYIEHPVPEDPVQKVSEAGPLPLMLTRAERKKLRTQTRVQREREKQQKIRLGVIPPPPPKANLRNFMRVHLNDGTADPTQLEKTIHGQIQQRIQNHLNRNEERALTKEEKYEKKLNKLREDEQKELLCTVFHIGDLTHPQNRHVIFSNAKDLKITGVSIICDNMNMIIAEGGPKSIRKFTHILCDRIDWNLPIDLTKIHTITSEEGSNTPAGAAQKTATSAYNSTGEKNNGNNNDEEEDADLLATLGGLTANARPMSMIKERDGNTCQLAWRGTQQKRNFENFKFHQFDKKSAIRRFLRRYTVPYYYDVCQPERNPELLRGYNEP